MRRIVFVVVLALVPAASALSATQAAGVETCRGKAVTVVGDPGNEVVGTRRDDVILSNGGAVVRADAGDDTICVTGGTFDVDAGDDILAGSRADDVLTGGPGDDEADGRDGTDTCSAEVVVRCETVAARPLVGLDRPDRKDIAMQIVSSAENSTLKWRQQYTYLEDIGDGRGYTGGIIGFCSGTGDMLEVVQSYTDAHPGNPLARFLPALREVDGTDSHRGLGRPFVRAWHRAARTAGFRHAQDAERDRVYFDPAVRRAQRDGLRTLGQFIYYDAIVMHGPGSSHLSFGGIRRTAMRHADTPADGGSEVAYLDAFLDARVDAMKAEEAHEDTSRVDTAQRVFLRQHNLGLAPPLTWHVYGDRFHIGRDAHG